MSVNTGQYLKGIHDQAAALGAKAVSSDFSLVIEGFEHLYFLTKQAPWPELSPAGEIEVAAPLGSTVWQPQQVKTAQQGQVSLMETVAGTVDKALVDIITSGGRFNAVIYEGTPEKFLRGKRITDCFLQMDPVDRDWENRSQPLIFSGTLFYHYYGEIIPGNSTTY